MLAKGLTTIGSIEAPDEGALSGSLFMLSIGMERLLKTLALLLHFEANGNWSINMRRFSHNIQNLLNHVITESARITTIDSNIFSDQISNSIIQQLTAFASTERYSNIDSLTGNVVSSPLASWASAVEDKVFAIHKRTPDSWVESRRELFIKLDSIQFISWRTYDGTWINNNVDFLELLGRYRVVSMHVKVYLGRMIRELCGMLRHFNLDGMDCLREYFGPFNNPDSYYRTKKRFP